MGGTRPSFNLPPGRDETINTIFEGFRVDQDNLLISEKILEVTIEMKTSFIFVSTSILPDPYYEIFQGWVYTSKAVSKQERLYEKEAKIGRKSGCEPVRSDLWMPPGSA